MAVPHAPFKPLVSLLLPLFDEAEILEENLECILAYIARLEDEYRWEIVLVNDGSRDDTARIADALAKSHPNVRVYHHVVNFGLGQALKFGFSKCRGDFVITLDIDLSYSPEHIGALLDNWRETHAKLVLASPYMKGGRISKVPLGRRVLSVCANRFLSFFSHSNLSTLTCLTRGYDGAFVRSLNIRSMGMEVMPEIIYKAMVLRARIAQIPAHLDWGLQVSGGTKRRSSMRLFAHAFATVVSGFMIRPFLFFILPGFLLLAFALYVDFWMLVHFFEAYAELGPGTNFSVAVAAAFRAYPHTFVVGLLSLMLSVQLISLGFLALQAKHYFEELFHMTTSLKQLLDRKSVV